ncbi:MAG: DUF3575 domain-containing protein [Flavobacteriales bacterium]|nr:DUF3575 domain-containing protein [Flavobacteriales bacterium]
MKTPLFCGSLLLLSILGRAQDGTSVADMAFSPKSIIKFNLVGYSMLSLNANYEYKVGPKTSVGMLTGYKIPSTFTLDAIGNLDDETMTYTGEITPEGLFVNPYFRFYTGKAMKGFYLEAFTRYYNYTYLVPYDYEKNGGQIRANLDGTANGFGGGLTIGVQLQLAPRIYLDINSGFGVGSGDMHVETNDPNLDAADFQNIKRNIEENAEDADIRIMFLGNTLDGLVAGSNDNSAWADINNELFPLFRGGICLGFGF